MTDLNEAIARLRDAAEMATYDDIADDIRTVLDAIEGGEWRFDHARDRSGLGEIRCRRWIGPWKEQP